MVHVYIHNDPLPTTDYRASIETILYHTDLFLSPAVIFSYWGCGQKPLFKDVYKNLSLMLKTTIFSVKCKLESVYTKVTIYNFLFLSDQVSAEIGCRDMRIVCDALN